MDLTLRPGTPADADPCGRICYEAFRSVAERHNFPADFPSVEVATRRVGGLLSHPNVYAVVAQLDSQIVGSNFLDERSMIGGLGPITVDPRVQDQRIGRQLMRAVLDRATEHRRVGVRLVQIAYHNRSLALYATLGFAIREPLACLQGAPIREDIAGHTVRPAIQDDLEVCNQLCGQVHGHDRGGEVRDAIGQGTATVVESGGRVTGYATTLAYVGHAVGESNEDLKALIAAAPALGGPGILVPLRNHALFPWCLRHGLRIVHVATLMTMGLYNEPQGAYLSSVLY